MRHTPCTARHMSRRSSCLLLRLVGTPDHDKRDEGADASDANNEQQRRHHHRVVAVREELLQLV